MTNKDDSNLKRNLVVHYSSKSPEAESFRILRTNLQFLTIDKVTKSILFTSVGPDEGKSTITANLGITLAQADKKAIVMDCDLRLPSQHRIFGCENIRGVTSIISGACSLQEAVLDPGYSGVKLLTAGPVPPNPGNLNVHDDNP
jgi:protein-tyrosine kinase